MNDILVYVIIGAIIVAAIAFNISQRDKKNSDGRRSGAGSSAKNQLKK